MKNIFVKKIIAILTILVCLSLAFAACTAENAVTTVEATAELTGDAATESTAPSESTEPVSEQQVVYEFSDSMLKYISSAVVGEAYSDGNYLVFTFEYTNKSDKNITFNSDIKIKAYQNGKELVQPTTSYGIDGYDESTAALEVKSGETVKVQKALELRSFDDTVSVALYDNENPDKPDYRFDMKPKAKR